MLVFRLLLWRITDIQSITDWSAVTHRLWGYLTNNQGDDRTRHFDIWSSGALPSVFVHRLVHTSQSKHTNTKTLELQGLSLTTGRPSSLRTLSSGAFVGKKSLKMKAPCIWQLRAAAISRVQLNSSTVSLSCVLMLTYWGLCAVSPNNHGRGNVCAAQARLSKVLN